MTERVLVRRETTSGPDYDPVISWSTVDTVWAKVEIIELSERVRNTVTEAFRNYRFIVRHNADIQLTDKLVWDGKQFDVRSLGEHSTRQRYQIIEAEGTANATAVP